VPSPAYSQPRVVTPAPLGRARCAAGARERGREHRLHEVERGERERAEQRGALQAPGEHRELREPARVDGEHPRVAAPSGGRSRARRARGSRRAPPRPGRRAGSRPSGPRAERRPGSPMARTPAGRRRRRAGYSVMLAAPAIGPSHRPASTTTNGCSVSGTGVPGQRDGHLRGGGERQREADDAGGLDERRPAGALRSSRTSVSHAPRRGPPRRRRRGRASRGRSTGLGP
jgi:hypothetical protein